MAQQPITDEQLQEWRKLANEATGGDWFMTLIASMMAGFPPYVAVHSMEGSFELSIYSGGRQEDAEFITAARTAVPALLDEVERLRTVEQRLATIRKEIDFALKVVPGEEADNSLRDALWMIDQLSLDIRTSNPIEMRQPVTIRYELNEITVKREDAPPSLADVLEEWRGFTFHTPQPSAPLRFFSDEAREAMESELP